jgi:hypothetical protein
MTYLYNMSFHTQLSSFLAIKMFFVGLEKHVAENMTLDHKTLVQLKIFEAIIDEKSLV